MSLVVDIGNTRIKWARSGRGGLRDFGSSELDTASGEPFAALHAAIGDSIRGITATNVAGDAVAAALGAFAARHAAELTLVRPAASGYGVRCAYADPSRLGADRWVAVVAAHRLVGGTVAVIDAGTTATLDIVTSDGVHLGGLILAGPALTANALLRQTQGIGATTPVERMVRGIELLGKSTTAAVAHGAIVALAAGLDRAITEVARELVEPVTVVLTGGVAPVLEPWLETEVSYRPHFVLEGLADIAAKR